MKECFIVHELETIKSIDYNIGKHIKKGDLLDVNNEDCLVSNVTWDFTRNKLDIDVVPV